MSVGHVEEGEMNKLLLKLKEEQKNQWVKGNRISQNGEEKTTNPYCLFFF